MPKPLKIAIIILALAVLGFGLSRFVQKQSAQQGEKDAPKQGEFQVTRDWKEYKDTDYKISFRYPPHYGDVVQVAGEPGKVLSFSGLPNIRFGSHTVNPRPATPSVFHFTQHKTEAGKTYFVAWYGAKSEIKPAGEYKVDGRTLLLINEASFVQKEAAQTYGPRKGEALLVNLGESNGMVFWNGVVVRNGSRATGYAPVDKKQFEEIIKSIRFN